MFKYLPFKVTVVDSVYSIIFSYLGQPAPSFDVMVHPEHGILTYVGLVADVATVISIAWRFSVAHFTKPCCYVDHTNNPPIFTALDQANTRPGVFQAFVTHVSTIEGFYTDLNCTKIRSASSMYALQSCWSPPQRHQF